MPIEFMPVRRVYLDQQRHDARRPARRDGNGPRGGRDVWQCVERSWLRATGARGDRPCTARVAALIDARQNEIVFTSGGTEANNLAIRGVCKQRRLMAATSSRRRSSIRRSRVFAELEKRGWEVTRLPVYQNGIVRIEDVARSTATGYRSDNGHARQ